MSDQNADPFGTLLARPSALTSFRLNATGLTQERRAELRREYEAQVEAELAPSTKAVSTADALAVVAKNRQKAEAYLAKSDEFLAAHAPAQDLSAVVDEIVEEEELYGTYDPDEDE
jgi:prephenate dehydrogenase